jgi:acyl carrier protein phosphodiesterase
MTTQEPPVWIDGYNTGLRVAKLVIDIMYDHLATDHPDKESTIKVLASLQKQIMDQRKPTPEPEGSAPA